MAAAAKLANEAAQEAEHGLSTRAGRTQTTKPAQAQPFAVAVKLSGDSRDAAHSPRVE
jgi:hypothetical protein